MHFNTFTLFLLVLVTCQAAPSPKLTKEQSISEPQSTFVTNGLQLESEDTDMEKGRAKKSTTTFCVQVRSGKPDQVPCRNEEQSHVSEPPEPVVIMEPISIPAPSSIVEYSKPLVIQSPENYILPIELQPSQPKPIVVSAPISTSAPVQTSILSPIINAIPQTLPCDEPNIIQSQLPQQFHKIEDQRQQSPLRTQSSKTMPYIHLSPSEIEQETPQSSSKLPPYEFPYHKAITVPDKLLPLLIPIKENTTISDDILHTIIEHLPKPSFFEILQRQNDKTQIMSEDSAQRLKDLIRTYIFKPMQVYDRENLNNFHKKHV
ncbi:uncharacterized protein [Cardiocondyla obscurior]|uniref:uncharacterized protein n=1 Tax=Cardiocondyla obscurior TaxID=286306 RepID=UPI0039658B55